MILCKKFRIEQLIRSDRVVLTYDRIKQTSAIKLSEDLMEGFIQAPSFFASWAMGYEGLRITESDLIDVRFSNEMAWLSIPAARQAIAEVDGAISIQIRLRRSPEGFSPTLSVLEFGYRVDGSILAFLHDIGLPNLLAAPVQLQRIIQSADALIEGFNPIRMSEKKTRPLDDRTLVSFDYCPIVIASQGEFQGGEIPAILIRLESQSNRRELGVSQYLRNSENSALKTQYAAVYDIVFDISVIAQRTQDVSMIVDRICQTLSVGKIDLPPFGLSFGISISNQITYDDPIRESDLATLPTASFNLTVHNVPLGQTSKKVDLITEICPVVFG